MTTLTITPSFKDGILNVKLAGKMDETANYSALRTQIDTLLASPGIKTAAFNFEAVSLINSKGIQVWKDFMTGLPAPVRIFYLRCPLRVVNQLNLFPSFNGGKKVTVKSFYAPYWCERCDAATAVLLQPAIDFIDGKISAPKRNCPKCQAVLSFDGSEQKYFLFLKRAP